MNEQSGKNDITVKNEKSSSDANKEKNIIRNWLILLAAPIICLTIVASFQNYHYQNMRNFNTRDIPEQKPNSKEYSAHEQFESKFDNYIKNRHKQIFESLTPEKQQEFIELENYIQGKLEPIFMNITPEQELYFIQNTELISQADYLNNYLNGYGYIIKWCSAYHPVDNSRIEYNNYFGSVKEKAKNILVSFIGDESFTKLDDFYSKDKKMLEFYNSRQESIYNTTGKSLMKVSKEEYCKIWNSDAKDIFQKGYERLKLRTPLLFTDIDSNKRVDSELNDGFKLFIDPFNSNYSDKLQKVLAKATQKQKDYIKNNKNLIQQAAAAYNAIQSQYYIVNWCEKYHKPNNFYKEVDNYFANKKHKVREILNNAGLIEFEITVKKNDDFARLLNKTQEEQYTTANFIKRNFTFDKKGFADRNEYCMSFDLYAKQYMLDIKQKYESKFPNF